MRSEKAHELQVVPDPSARTELVCRGCVYGVAEETWMLH